MSYTRNSVGQITSVKMQDDDLAPEVTVASAIAYAPFGPMTDIDTVEGLTIIQDLTQVAKWITHRSTLGPPNRSLNPLLSDNTPWVAGDVVHSIDGGGFITRVKAERKN